MSRSVKLQSVSRKMTFLQNGIHCCSNGE